MALHIVTTLIRSIDTTFRVPGSSSKRAAYLFFLIPALLLGGCATEGVRNTSRTFKTVIIDAGHGGYDRGTQSSRLILEKTAALDIALKVNQRLKAAGFTTVLSGRVEYFVDLNVLAALSNKYSVAIFVCIHLNECRSRPGIHVTVTYYYSSSSEELARRLLLRVGSVPGGSAHFMKTANFRVLKRNQNPAVLVECGYLTNRAEAARFATEDYRQAVANAIAAAIIDQRRQ